MLKYFDRKVSLTARETYIFVSFYGGRQFYFDSADLLQQDLDAISVDYHLREVTAQDPDAWATLCAYKIQFLFDMRQLYPDKVLVWIDIDSRVIDRPKLLDDVSGLDFMAFPRGFSHPLTVGYSGRTRFFEPSFTVWFPTLTGNAFLRRAYELYRVSDAARTDDFFLEEAWREFSLLLNWAFLPVRFSSTGCQRYKIVPDDVFFVFVSSGSVQLNISKVEQHGLPDIVKRSHASQLISNRSSSMLKRIHLRLDSMIRTALGERVAVLYREMVYSIHHSIFGTKSTGQPSLKTLGASAPQTVKWFASNYESFLTSKKDITSEFEVVTKLERELDALGILDERIRGQTSQLRTIKDYAQKYGGDAVNLTWWHQPSPGNFGDWLSPLIFSHIAECAVRFSHPKACISDRRILSLGSIARFAGSDTVVVGSGFSERELSHVSDAEYVSLRGPLSAEMVREKLGTTVSSFGDPGVLIRRVFDANKLKLLAKSLEPPKNPVCFVSHFAEEHRPPIFTKFCDRLSIRVASPTAIELLIAQMLTYEYVITSAMHIVITCQSYGIPVVFVSFKGRNLIAGDGMKYRDYAEGAEVAFPEVVLQETSLFLREVEPFVTSVAVADKVLDRVTGAIRKSVDLYRLNSFNK